ncbi:MAG: hypothetical protein N2234_03105 [Planctomycetota bacterium]|nr:hypothetical protein [Planctomycetota bacterium]
MVYYEGEEGEEGSLEDEELPEEKEESPFEFEDTGIEPQPEPPKEEALLPLPEESAEEAAAEGEEGEEIVFEEVSEESSEEEAEKEVEEAAVVEEVVEKEEEEKEKVPPAPRPVMVKKQIPVEEKQAPQKVPQVPVKPKTRPAVKSVPPKEVEKKPPVKHPEAEPVEKQMPATMERPAREPPAPVVKRGKGALVLAIIFLVMALGAGYLYYDAANKLADEREKYKKEVEALKSQLEGAKRQWAEEVGNAKREINDLNGKLKEERSKAITAQKDLEEMQNKYESMKDLYEKAREKSEHLLRLSVELEEMRGKNTELENQVKTLERIKEEKEAQLGTVSGLLDGKMKELEEANRQINNLKAQLQKMGSGSVGGDEATKARLNELEKMVKTKNDEIASLLTQMEEMKRSGGVIKVPKTAVGERLKVVEESLKRKQREIAVLQESLIKSEKERRLFVSPLKTVLEWVSANNTRDVRQVVRYYATTSDFWKRWTTRESDAEVLRSEFQKFIAKGVMKVDVKRIVIEGERAICWMDVVMEGAGGKEIFAAKMVLVRENEEWKIEDEGF